MIVAPNSPSPRANDESCTGAEAAGRERQRHATRTSGPGPRRACATRRRATDRPPRRRRSQSAEKNGPATKTMASTTASRVNGMSAPIPERRPAQEADATERCEEPDPGDGRREDERQLDQRDDEHPAAEPPRREKVRGRRSDEQDRRLGDQRRRQCDPQRIACDLRPERVHEVRRGYAEEDRHNREHEECELRGSPRPRAPP